MESKMEVISVDMLNEEQKVIYDIFVDDRNKLRSLEHKYYLLDAPAGTGKTELIKRIRASLSKKLVQILAPTHKAVSLLPAFSMTIHRFFGARQEFDEEGNIEFDFRAPCLQNCPVKLIIIDEASMISSKMLKSMELIDRAFLFICDRAQLPPVNEDISPIYNLKNRIDLTLTKNMRIIGDTPYFKFVQYFRERVFNPKKTYCSLKPISSTMDEMFQYFRNINLTDPIILTWTNHRRDYWNGIIRNHIFSDQINSECPLQKFYVNEKLVFSGFRKVLDDEGKHVRSYYSSETIDIVELSTREIFLEFYPTSCQHSREDPKKSRCSIQECLKCGITKHQYLGYNISFDRIIDQYGVEWFIPKEKNDHKRINDFLKHHKKHILTIKKILPHNAVKEEWIKWYDFKGKYQPELSYTYASTTHKAQGSQWKTVFLDYTNIATSNESIRDRLIYTAVSRMRRQIHII